jgi:hypothetical protein
MCKYSDGAYRYHYICVSCRYHIKFGPFAVVPLCPSCGAALVNVGHDFAAPRKTNDSQWAKLALMAHQGRLAYAFNSCGCGGHYPGRNPATLGQARHPGLR